MIVVCFCVNAQGSKTKILLVGSIHHIPDSLDANWKKLRSALYQFRPQIICVEYRIPTDTVSLQNASGLKIFQRLDSISNSWKAKVEELAGEARDFNLFIKQFSDYYTHADFGNANYQAYRLNKYFWHLLAKFPNNGIIKQITTIKNNLRQNEYWNVIFPVADSLKIPYLFPTDNWVYNLLFSSAYQSWSKELGDTHYMNKWKQSYEVFNQIENNHLQSKDAIEFVNSAAWQKNADYIQTGLLTEAKNENYQEWVGLWHQRNHAIAKNIESVVAEFKPSKMLVVFGYMHIPVIKRELKKGRQSRISVYGEINVPY